MTTVRIEILRNLPFLEAAGADVLEGLAKAAVERSFQPGQVILQEGSAGRELYLIVEGLVEVVKERDAEETVLARRGPGDFFGEMGLLEASPRFATIRTLEPTRLLEFSEPELRSVLIQQPLLLYRVTQVLSARLREADLRMIADLQRKNQELAQAYRELQEAQAALVEKERLERELELARELQQSILPQEFPDLPGFNCAARNRPARQVGGDFYDVIPLSRGRVGLVMADVSDKGLAAALYMALTRSLIHAEAKHSSSPRKVLLKIHRLLLEMGQADMFVTAFYGVLDPAQHTLRYSRAGHDRPLLFSPTTGECRFLAADGTLLGYFEEVRLEEVDLDLRPGDLLVLYTDGITDANSPTGEFFGVERLRETVCAAGGLDPQSLCDLIFDRVERFQAGTVQHDDMALLVVKATTDGLWPD
ncbi:MAG: cyclic nucleotide-binding domain-containing protein [Chloroflexi bacterium]|nr:cyclic nucleotide-binding domain-containing protein [Chloroflexota bacterium]